MKTILTALALVLSATAANAATYTFDLYSTPSVVTPGTTPTPVLAGSGTFSLTDAQTTATAIHNESGLSVYEPVAFDLKLDFTNWAWTDRDLTIGRVRVARVPGATVCVYPSGTCTTPPPSNTIGVDFIGGALNLRSPEVLSDLNLSQTNVDRVFSNATGGSMTLNQTSIYGVTTGPVSLQLSNFRALPDVAPVPEPGEWAMMIAGLGLVGGIARRRRH